MNNSTQSILRALLKIGGGALIAKGVSDDAQIESIIGGIIAGIGLIAGLLKARSTAASKGAGPVLLMCCLVALLASLFVGCVTGPDGTRQLDIVKVTQAKALIEPVAAGALRRALQNSPEHAPALAKYAASVAGVFCTMSLSNEFRPEFLIEEANKFADPELAKIGDGYLIDVKNAGVGIYKVLYGDRFRAEIGPTNFMHFVAEFFCESISTALIDLGYPGGVRKTTSVGAMRRDLEARMEAAEAKKRLVSLVTSAATREVWVTNATLPSQAVTWR